MNLDISQSIEIIETMENYISKVRPRIEIRHQIDINYEIEGQSIILNEIRPFWNDPSQITINGYAKATYVKSKNLWKIFWKRANNNWDSYQPNPTVIELKQFLKQVDEDKFGCFKG